MNSAEVEVQKLYDQRSRNHFVIWSGVLLLTLMTGSWFIGDFHLDDFFSERHLVNLGRFLNELVPFSLQGRPFSLTETLGWAGRLFWEKGLAATGVTLAISVAAIVLAGSLGALFSLPAARNFMAPDPFIASLSESRQGWGLLWTAAMWGTRAFLIFARAIPEYLWAFLFLTILGPTAAPAVLALGLHNLGILGKLGAEVVENTEGSGLSALRGLGASRLQISLAGLFPLAYSRFLLFFFYRWETCVREATVLGMLGIVSLGYWIQDARARNHYDEMFFLVLLGAFLVLAGDLLSAFAREMVRRYS
jgi:phosphonate transport system permease protein